jgi:conjugal transfer pilus assembly protein TraB
MKKLLSRLTASTPDPGRMRFQQIALVMGLVILSLVLGKILLTGSSEVLREEKTQERKESVSLNTPFEAVNPRDIWVNRVQTQAEEAKGEARAVREENKLLNQKVDALEKLFQSGSHAGGEKPSLNIPPSSDLPVLDRDTSPPQKAPPLSVPEIPFSPHNRPLSEESLQGEDRLLGSASSSRILQVSLQENLRGLLKNTENYVPAGSYARAVLTSGVVASTALQASSQPQPVLLRLVDDGHLPRGFDSAMRDNVLIGACYGDLSSERVQCRLETMSWVEQDGVTVEKKVEGWVIGEDGRPGLRGEVVDRSGEAVRDTLLAGMLSGLSGFLKQEATSSVYPVSPFGQTNALKGKQALGGAAGTGAGNALDKLAEFSIKRAEQMQPVILIASGRVVDVVFKSGVDLRPEATTPSLTLIDTSQRKEQKHDKDF